MRALPRCGALRRWRPSSHPSAWPTRIPGLGIVPTHEQLEEMAKSCAAACGGKKGSARVLHEADMLAIYEAAMKD